MTSDQLHNAYTYCARLAREHYENFPVASRFVPAGIRPAITVIYTFARTADDFADEGELTPAQRHDKLQQYSDKLQKLKRNQPLEDPLFIALSDVVARHNLPIQPFEDLLSAFKQDVDKKRYASFGEVMDYCRCSANPIGELLLYLQDAATPKYIGYSNAICTALQLINFLQDIYQDYSENNRIYLPQDEMQKYGVSEQHIAGQTTDFAMQALMRMQIERARKLLEAGAPLGLQLGGRFGFELRLIIAGGARILKHLYDNPNDAFARPRLNAQDKIAMFWQALFPRFTGRWRSKSTCGI